MNLVTLLAAYLAFGSVLEGATGLPSGAWIVLLFAVNAWFLWRGSMDATVASAMLIGVVNIAIIVVIALLTLPHVTAENLAYADVPLLDGRPLDATVIGLVFGVVLMAYFGHTSAANAAKVVLERDPTGRGLLWGNMAALARGHAGLRADGGRGHRRGRPGRARGHRGHGHHAARRGRGARS